MTEWLKDVRYVVRMIAKRPGTSAIAIVALALGIGLTTTMFSIVQGVILRGLPFEAGDQKRIAVKVIDHRGNEIVRVMDLKGA